MKESCRCLKIIVNKEIFVWSLSKCFQSIQRNSNTFKIPYHFFGKKLQLLGLRYSFIQNNSNLLQLLSKNPHGVSEWTLKLKYFLFITGSCIGAWESLNIFIRLLIDTRVIHDPNSPYDNNYRCSTGECTSRYFFCNDANEFECGNWEDEQGCGDIFLILF